MKKKSWASTIVIIFMVYLFASPYIMALTAKPALPSETSFTVVYNNGDIINYTSLEDFAEKTKTEISPLAVTLEESVFINTYTVYYESPFMFVSNIVSTTATEITGLTKDRYTETIKSPNTEIWYAVAIGATIIFLALFAIFVPRAAIGHPRK